MITKKNMIASVRMKTSVGMLGNINHCHDITMSRCHDISIPRCHDISISRCHDMLMSRCHDISMSRYLDVSISRCHDITKHWREIVQSSICSPCLSRQQVCCAHCFCDTNGVHILEILRVARNVQRRRGKVHKTARVTINSMFTSRDFQDFGATTQEKGMSGMQDLARLRLNKQTRPVTLWTVQKVLYGERARLARSAHLLYKTLYWIIARLAFRDTLVHESDNWSTY